MPFQSLVLNVLIASPSDLTDERRTAQEAVHEWNDLHAEAEAVVLLPRLWETSTTPESSGRPQAFVNRQIVDHADLLIGMFWTKMGTKTALAESATVEEIDRIVGADKPAMLYFSDREVSPSKIDAKQINRLKKFKVETYKKALVGSFRSPDELKQTLLKDLTRRVRMMKISQIATTTPTKPDVSPAERIEVKVTCMLDHQHPHRRWLCADVLNAGADLYDLAAVFGGDNGNGDGFNKPMMIVGDVPNPMKRTQSRRFRVGNDDPSRPALNRVFEPRHVLVIVFSGVREIARYTGDTFAEELTKWEQPDPLLPRRPEVQVYNND